MQILGIVFTAWNLQKPSVTRLQSLSEITSRGGLCFVSLRPRKLPLNACHCSLIYGASLWDEGANHRSCTTYFNFFLFVISNLSLFPWQLFQSSMTLIDSELKYVLTDITRSGDLCLYSKACPDPGKLANWEALASEDTRPILPRPTLKQKFSFSAPV